MSPSKKSQDYLDLFDSQDSDGTDSAEGESRKDSEEFARMLDDSLKSGKRRFSPGDKVRGKILVIGKEEIFVSLGAQDEAAVPRRDCLDAEGKLPYQVGDSLELFITQVRRDEIKASPKPTAKNLADDLQDAFDMMMPVEGRVMEICKGGFRVSVHGKLAFCPISQMDNRRIETPEEYVGKRFEFNITQLSEGGRNVVVSRRKLLEEQSLLTRETFLSEHKAGEVVPGKIKRLDKFGAFVEVAPGLEGLAHISELAWSRVNDPAEVVSVGQEVSVKILKIENGEGKVRISLSIKQAGDQPWEKMPGEIQAGQVLEGKVTRCAKFGAFVELSPGIEGLIPLSEMSHTKRVMRSDELVKEGDRITVKVLDVNPETRRISLSLKDAGDDPWALVPHKFPVGAVVPGTVERREPYGIFIKLDDGIVGLLPKSKANERPEFPFEKLKVGETVTVQVGELRLEERRMSLQPPGDSGAEEWKAYSRKQQASGSLGTLGGAFGDKLKAAMAQKKAK